LTRRIEYGRGALRPSFDHDSGITVQARTKKIVIQNTSHLTLGGEFRIVSLLWAAPSRA
jgi:hypothetical protein